MFLSDGTTDKDCVDTLVAAYTYLAHNNYTFLDRELDMIITYKRKEYHNLSDSDDRPSELCLLRRQYLASSGAAAYI